MSFSYYTCQPNCICTVSMFNCLLCGTVYVLTYNRVFPSISKFEVDYNVCHSQFYATLSLCLGPAVTSSENDGDGEQSLLVLPWWLVIMT